jgi:FKBP-type peptidyl-prolyl cis-trans isomerase 2
MFKQIFQGLVVLILLAILVFGGMAMMQGGGVKPANNATATPTPGVQVNIATIQTGENMVVEKGDTVSVWYLGTLDDGSVFDTNLVEEAKKAKVYTAQRPYVTLDFEVGAGNMIKGFDAGVLGMKVNETKTLKLKPAEAYGERNPAAIIQVPLEDLKKNGVEPAVGLVLQTGTGQTGNITAIVGANATIDFNHFLAGKSLTFKVTIDKITKKKA